MISLKSIEIKRLKTSEASQAGGKEKLLATAPSPRPQNSGDDFCW